MTKTTCFVLISEIYVCLLSCFFNKLRNLDAPFFWQHLKIKTATIKRTIKQMTETLTPIMILFSSLNQEIFFVCCVFSVVIVDISSKVDVTVVVFVTLIVSVVVFTTVDASVVDGATVDVSMLVGDTVDVSFVVGATVEVSVVVGASVDISVIIGVINDVSSVVSVLLHLL